MMSAKAILARGIDVVIFLFAAFSGFLSNIAPPEETNVRFAVGIASFFTLIIYLFIASLSQGKKRWLISALVSFLIAIAATFFYLHNFDKLTFKYPLDSDSQDLYIRGTEFTTDAEEYQKETPLLTASELVARFEGPNYKSRVWKSGSIRRARIILTINYVILVLSIASTIFCLVEGLLVRSKVSKPPRMPAGEEQVN